MLKYIPEDTSITFTEFPDEIALCINISQCPCLCIGCSENYLQKDIGEILTESAIDSMISKYNNDCTIVGFMGGDIDHNEVGRLADYIHTKYNIKVGMYSGLDYIDLDLANHLDVYKIGRWIMPDKEHQRCGPLSWPNTNQRYYEKIDRKLVDKTDKFKRHNNLELGVIR